MQANYAQLQANYAQLQAKGTGSQDAAPDVQRVYGHLLIAFD